MKTSLVISVWGDPNRWHEMPYTIEGKTYKGKNNSTLVIRDHFNAKATVIAPASLVNPCSKGIPTSKFSEQVRKYVENFFPDDSFDVIVAPTVGTFSIDGGSVSFKGKVDLFKVFVFWNLLKIFAKNGEDLNLYLDITYGLNYMTVENFEAVKLAVALYCVLQDKNVTLVVANSDPVSVVDRDTLVGINFVEKLNFNRQSGTEYIYGELQRRYDKNKFMWSKLTGNGLNIEVDTLEIKSLFSAMHSFGAFLPCLIRNQKLQGYLSNMDEFLQGFVDSVFKDMDYKNNVYSYKFPISEGIILVYSALKIITMKNFENKGDFAPLSKLEELSKMRLTHESAKHLLSEEINNIKNRKSSLENGKTVLLQEMYENEESKKPCGSNSRIIVAHCAMEMNITYIRKEYNKILLGYGNCLDSLITILKNM